jgi:hypothetical protein
MAFVVQRSNARIGFLAGRESQHPREVSWRLVWRAPLSLEIFAKV